MSDLCPHLPTNPDFDQARSLYRLRYYAQALRLFEARCNTSAATCWDFYYLASSLYKLQRYNEAREACRRAWKMFPDPRPQCLRNLSGWCIYQLDLKRFVHGDADESEELESGYLEDGQAGRIQAATSAAQSICEITTPGDGSPFVRAVLTLARIFKSAARWQQLEEWTARLDPSILSSVPWMPDRPDKTGKRREIASELETWYGLRTKALLQMERHAECVDLCVQYERAGLKPHHDYDVWVPFYRAQSLRALGRREEAHSIIDHILRKKRAPCILRVKSQLLQDDGDVQGAWKVAIDGALELRDAKSDPKLILHLGRLARERADIDAARRHFQLILQTWASQDWKLSEALRVEAEDAGAVLSETATVAATDQLFRELQCWWWKELEAIEPRTTGVIETITGSGGFIRASDGSSIFFNARELKHAAVGVEVGFWIRESWDHKKDRVSQCAIRVRKLKANGLARSGAAKSGLSILASGDRGEEAV
jgi:tetratricopeptide (TPR) repeat protein